MHAALNQEPFNDIPDAIPRRLSNRTGFVLFAYVLRICTPANASVAPITSFSFEETTRIVSNSFAKY